MDSLLSDLPLAATPAPPARSSWDQRGRNHDNWIIPAGETRVLADLEGPGWITHIWMTQSCRRSLGPGLHRPRRHRRTCPMLEIHNALGAQLGGRRPRLLPQGAPQDHLGRPGRPRACSCRSATSSVSVHSLSGQLRVAALFTVSAKPEESLHRSVAAPRSTASFQMPFNTRARIVVEQPERRPLPAVLLHRLRAVPRAAARGHRVLPRPLAPRDPATAGGRTSRPTASRPTCPNLDGEDNYVVLETEGRGPLRRLQPLRPPLPGLAGGARATT